MKTFARTMFAVATNVLPQHGFISGAQISRPHRSGIYRIACQQ